MTRLTLAAAVVLLAVCGCAYAYLTPQVINAGVGAEYMVTGDCNGDGFSDIATRSKTNQGRVLVSDGAGGYASPFDYSSDAHGVALGRIDPDGYDDLVVSQKSVKALYWRKSDGAGGFDTAVTLSNAYSGAFALNVADFDQDGDGDVLFGPYLGSTPYGVYIYENTHPTGDGSSWALHTLEVSERAFLASVRDINGDGFLDVAVAFHYVGEIGVYFWNAATGLAAWDTQILSVGDYPRNIDFGDMNGDGLLDLVTTSNGYPQARYYPAQSTTTWSPSYTTVASGAYLLIQGIDDFNGDGLADVLLSQFSPPPSPATNSLILASGNAGGSFSMSNILTGTPIYNAALATISPDGGFDVVIGTETTGVSYVSEPGVPNFSGWAALGIGQSFLSQSARAVAAVDLDGSGSQDLIVTDNTTVWWVESLGAMGAGLNVVALFEYGPDPVVDLAIADTNLDASLDIVFVTGSALLKLDNPATLPTPSQVAPTPLNIASLPTPFIAADFVNANGDLCPDLVITSTSAVSIMLAAPACDGSMLPPTVVATAMTPTLLPAVAVDLTNDAVLDLVWVETGSSSSLWVAQGTGPALFSAPVAYAAGTTALAVQMLVAPVSRSPDGMLDIVLVFSDGSLAGLEATAPGVFPASLDWSIASGSPSIRASLAHDLNADGRSELVLVTDNDLLMWIGQDTAARYESRTLASGSTVHNATSVFMAALNTGLGFMDLVVTTNNSVVRFYPSVTATSVLYPGTRPPFSQPECGGVPNTLACIQAEIVISKLGSGSSKFTLPEGPIYGCAKLDAPKIFTSITVRGAAAGSTFECAVHGGGAVFAIDNNAVGQLTLEDLAINGATTSDKQFAALSVDVTSSAMGSLTLNRVNMSRCSSKGASSFVPTAGYGSAVQVIEGYLYVVDSRFVANTASKVGGAVAYLGYSLTVTGTTFADNTAGASGGALFLSGSSPTLGVHSSVFSGNTATTGHGGALFVSSPDMLSLSMSDTTLSDNYALNGAGGAVAVTYDPNGAAMSNTWHRVMFKANSAVWGGSLAAFDKSIDMPEQPGSYIPPAPEPQPFSPMGGQPNFVLSDCNVTDSSANYGGIAFVCGAGFNMQSTGVQGTIHAAYGGAVVYECLNSATWLLWDPGHEPVGTLGPFGYGHYNATPPIEIVPPASSPIPNSAPSGAQVSGGALILRDAVGSQITDPQLAITVSLDPTGPPLPFGPYEVGGVSFGLTATTTTGEFELDALTVTATTWPAGLGTPVPLVAHQLGSDASDEPVFRFAVSLTACPEGFGRSSKEDLPLVCSECGTGLTSSNMSTAPCDIQVLCSAGAALVDGVCQVCPANTERAAPTENSTIPEGDCLCDRSYWSPTGQPNVACVACPAGGICEGGTASPDNAPGWAPSEPGSVTSFVVCPVEAACLSGARCAAGYEGLWCKDCQDGYYRQQDGTCEVCPGGSAPLFFLFLSILVLTAVIAVVVVVITISALAQNIDDSTHAVSRNKLLPNAISQGIFFAQVLGILASSSQFKWPDPPVQSVLDTATLFNLGLEWFATECTVSSFVTHYMFSVLLPLLLAVMVGAFATLVRFVPALFPCLSGQVLRRVGLATAAERLLLLLAPLLYIPMARMSLVILDCTKYPDGKYYLDSEYSIECFAGGPWSEVLPVGIVAIGVYVVLLPVYIAVVLYRFRGRLGEWAVQARLGVIVNTYRARFFYEELLLLGKRLAVVSSALFFSNVMLGLFSGLFGTYLAFTVHQLAHEPYHSADNNLLETRLNVITMVIVLCGVAFWADEFPNDVAFGMVVATVLGAIVLAMFWLVTSAVREIARRRSNRKVSATSAPDPHVSRHDLHLLNFVAERVEDVDSPHIRIAAEDFVRALATVGDSKTGGAPPGATGHGIELFGSSLGSDTSELDDELSTEVFDDLESTG